MDATHKTIPEENKNDNSLDTTTEKVGTAGGIDEATLPEPDSLYATVDTVKQSDDRIFRDYHNSMKNHRGSTDSTKRLIDSEMDSTVVGATHDTISEEDQEVNPPDITAEKTGTAEGIDQPTLPGSLYATVGTVKQDEYTHSSLTSSIDQSQYAQLNLHSQPRAALPQQSVEYIQVDHNRTAKQWRTNNIGSGLADTSLSLKSQDHIPSFSPPPPPIPPKMSENQNGMITVSYVEEFRF